MKQQARRFPPATSPVQEDGWLSPDGVFYPCGFWNHCEAAMEIDGIGSSDLKGRGWVHISGGCIEAEREQPQIDTLFEMLMVDPEFWLGMNVVRCLLVDGSY